MNFTVHWVVPVKYIYICVHIYIYIHTSSFLLKVKIRLKQFSFLEKGKSWDVPWSSARIQGQTWCRQLREFHLLCSFILCLSHYLWHSISTAGPHVLCAAATRKMSCSAIIAVISLKEVNLCWNEKLGSFFEPKLTQPESKVFTDITSFFLDSAALKTPDRKKEKHLRWFFVV